MKNAKKALIGSSLLLLVLITTGCAATRPAPSQRAIWVTRFDYKSPEDVQQIVQDCGSAGFNTIMFQVRGNGTVFYNSTLEPWADELGGTNPGWDPLQLAIEEAHQRGIELHAWVNVMPAWRGTEPPDNPKQLYNAHPEWFWYDQHGDRQALSSFYVSLNPCLPEVRAYIVDVFHELVANYAVDGLHMDYIRFPNEPPATPRGSGIDYPRDDRTLALYRAATGLAPDDDAAAWNKWRCAQVTQLVDDIHAMMQKTRPQAALSAAVGSIHKRALHHFQDSEAWLQRDLLDLVILMNYTDDPQVFGQRIDAWMTNQPKVPVVPGLWFGRHQGKTVEAAMAAVIEQIKIAREKTGNFCLFAYSSLFDSTDTELTKQNQKQQKLRRTRRAILLPVLKELAGAPEPG